MDYKLVFGCMALFMAIRIRDCIRGGMRYYWQTVVQYSMLMSVAVLPVAHPNMMLAGMRLSVLVEICFVTVALGPIFLHQLQSQIFSLNLPRTGLWLQRCTILLDWSTFHRIAFRLSLANYRGISGNVEGACTMLHELEQDGIPAELELRFLESMLFCCIQLHNWEEAVAFLERKMASSNVKLSSPAVVYAIRAYAELGRFEEAQSLVGWLKNHAGSRMVRTEYTLALVMLDAIRGDLETLEQHITRLEKVKGLMPVIFSYWRGLAHYHAGENDKARDFLLQAREQVPPRVLLWRKAIQRYLDLVEQGDGRIAAVSGSTTTPPMDAMQGMTNNLAEVDFQRGLFGWAPMAVLLLFSNLLCFALLELYGGSTNYFTLIAFGAKLNELIIEGELWRLLTHMFLHYGFLHLMFNMCALCVWVFIAERIYGSARMLIAYMTCGLLSSLASFLFVPNMSVGASGAIFGIVGMMVAMGIRFRAAIPGRFRRIFGWGLAPWVALTLGLGLIPGLHMDNAAHIAGFLCGVLLGLLMRPSFAPLKKRGKKSKHKGLFKGMPLRVTAALAIYLWVIALVFIVRPVFKASRIYMKTFNVPALDWSIGVPYSWKQNPGRRYQWLGFGVSFTINPLQEVPPGRERDWLGEWAPELAVITQAQPVSFSRGVWVQAEDPEPQDENKSRDMYRLYVVRPHARVGDATLLMFRYDAGQARHLEPVMLKIAQSVKFGS